MKANELMIGNWLYSVIDRYDHIENKPCKVVGIRCDGDELIQTDENDVWYHVGTYKPIPLTDEILVKNGFVKDGDVLHLKVTKKMCGDGFEIQEAIIHPRNIVVLITCVATIKMQCKYVHQLQNAFTQSEFNKDIVL